MIRNLFKNNYIWLVMILVIGIFFRVYRLSSVPPSPSLDEASIGYNAYSIMQTGRDEFGNRLPILLRAYDDYRPALYVYLVIPFVKLIGLNVVAVRLPSVILSIMVLISCYFLTSILLREQYWGQKAALISTFLLAISPWHIYISRLGHEVNLSADLTVFSLLFFFLAVSELPAIISISRKIFLTLSGVLFALSFYGYQSQKVFGPLLGITLLFLYRKNIQKFGKSVFPAAVLSIFIILPIFISSFSPQALLRFQGTSLFSNLSTVESTASERELRDSSARDFLGTVIDNRRFGVAAIIGQAYFSHFNPTWLFFNSGDEKHKIPNFGLFYWWELPLLLAGSFTLIKLKISKKIKFLLISWGLFAILPAAITTDYPHAMRTYNLLPVPQILSGLGLITLYYWVLQYKKIFADHRFTIKLSLSVLVILFMSFNLFFLYHNYFVNFPAEQSESFQYALSQSLPYIQKVEGDYQKVVISNQGQLYQSYMFFLFSNSYNPFQYLALGGTKSGGFNETHQIGKYEFRPISWTDQTNNIKTLYVGGKDDFPVGSNVLATFNSLDHKPTILVVAGRS
jgi:4-amino-4-deoxy-L-arabinose transferase-like glycosyltransferase